MPDKFYRNFFVVLVTIGAIVVLYRVRTLLTPVFSALLVAYILYPLITAAGKIGIRKGLAIFIIFLVITGILVGGSFTLLPKIRDQALRVYAENIHSIAIQDTAPSDFEAPEITPPDGRDVWRQASADPAPDIEVGHDIDFITEPGAIRPAWQIRLEKFPLVRSTVNILNGLSGAAEEPLTAANFITKVSNWVQDIIQPALGGWDTVLGTVGGFAKNTFQFVLIFLFVLVFALLDGDRLYKGIIQLIPNSFFEPGVLILKTTSDMLGNYLRGLLIENLILFVIAFTMLAGLSFLSQLTVLMALVIAAIIALTNVIRIVGPFIGAGVALLIVLFSSTDFTAMTGIVIIAVVIQILDNVLVLPMVMQEQVNVHPVFCVVGVLMGGILAGILGMIVAIPALGAVQVIYRILTEEMKKFNMDPDQQPDYFSNEMLLR